MPVEGLAYRDLFAGRGFDLPTMMRQMQARMAAEGLVYRTDRDRTWNTRLAQELAAWARAVHGVSLDAALFRAVFTEGQNVALPEVLLAVAEAAGLPRTEAATVLAERSHRAQVDADWRRARELGVTGVPTYVVQEAGTGRLRGVVGAQPYEQLVHLVKLAGGVERTPG